VSILRIFALSCLLSILPASAALSGPVQDRGIFGSPQLRFTFQDLPEGSIVSSESLLGPAVVESSTGGGFAEGNLSATEGVAEGGGFGEAGLRGSATLALDGPGSARVSLSGKVRTTKTTPVLPDRPFADQTIIVGPNTFIDIGELTGARWTLSYAFSADLWPDEENISIIDEGSRRECTQAPGISCSTFFDINSAPAFLPVRPGRPLVFDTFLSYDATLEIPAVAVAEPPPLFLAIPALTLLWATRLRGRHRSMPARTW
jgi:hypothetical protein